MAGIHSNASVPKRKDELIHIRVDKGLKAFLIQAASLRGQTLSDFILSSARREAEVATLDQTFFSLDAEQHEAFVALLDAPSTAPGPLKLLIKREPLWNM